MLTAELELGSYSLTFDGTPDSYGGVWYVNGMDYSSDVETSVTQFNSAHGGYVGDAWLKPRVFDINVTYVGATQQGKHRARTTLQRLLALTNAAPATLTFTDYDTFTAAVQRNGSTPIKRLNPTSFQVSISLIAGDPRLYHQEIKTYPIVNPVATAAGIVFPVTFPITFPANGITEVTAYNAGNISTPLEVSIYGPLTTPGIYNPVTGASVIVDTTLNTGDTLSFDSRKKIAKINGVYRATTQTSLWFDCEPGYTTVRLLGTGGTNGGNVYLRDAYDL